MSSEAGAGIAVVGMAVLLPGAPDLATYWRNLREGVDSISEVPAERWDPVFYDPESRAADRFYCRRGGFVDAYATFDPAAFGIMPVALEGAEPDQLLALRVAAEALADAGPSVRHAARERTGVILGRGGYLTAGVARLEQRVRTAQQLVECLRGLLPNLSEDELARVKTEFQAQLGPERPESSIGLVPNLAASRIANRLDLQGPAYTVDAACASSLIAVDHAVQELVHGRCDLVIAGGVHFCHDVTLWSVFSQLRALSPTAQIRPFDRAADGILIGEGTGMVVLKRLADAEHDNDRIYAVIRGTGVASDGRESSLMKPRVEGQLLALERAWRAAGCDPASIGLIEAHGTGTPAGDEAELRTLARFFGAAATGSPKPGLGSVKSMIGHAMPAAGIAGLIKAALAVHHGVLPPTLHCTSPHPLMAETRFRPITAVEPWEAPHGPRRAGVNAFGFGGINAHVVLESHDGPRARPRVSVPAPDRVLLFAAPDTASLLRALAVEKPGDADGLDAEAHTGPVRLAIATPTPERVAMARKVVERGRPWRGRNDIWFTTDGLAAAGGRIAVLFPGVEPSFAPQVDDLAEYFGFDKPNLGSAGDIEGQGFGIIEVGRLAHAVLHEIGVQADEVAGHSIGEWSGMIATEMIPRSFLDDFVGKVQRGNLELPDVIFVVAGCSAEKANAALEGLEGVSVSHDNCPHQAILCGRSDSIRTARERLRAQRVLCEELPFRSGFHSPLLADHLPPLLEPLRRIPLQMARTRMWSATTCDPYPADAPSIRELMTAHFVMPVRFRELTERLYAEGVRIFLQAGLGSLVGFVDDTLKGRDHLGVSVLVPRCSGLSQLRRVAAALFVEGVPVRLDRLFATAARRAGVPHRLCLGVPLVKLQNPIASLSVTPPVTALRRGDPLLDEFDATLREAAEAGRQVVDLWQRGKSALRVVPHRDLDAVPPEASELAVAHSLSLDSMPELIDHCFYRQPPDWTDVTDRFPVVPMTAIIHLMVDAARQLRPQQVVVGVESVRVFRWLAVAPPVEVTVRARADSAGRVKVTVDGYASATVLVAATYPAAPAPRGTAMVDERPTPVDAADLYAQHWLFHGPAYQGIAELGPTADNGIRGVIINRPAPGALLDNAGQLMGYWVMLNAERDHLALPVSIERIRFFGPEPLPGRRLECRVWIVELSDTQVRADLELCCDGQVWALVEDWNDKRFDSDDVVWPMLRFPEQHLLADPGDRPYVLVRERWRSPAARELMMRRYLSAAERVEYEMNNPRAQRQWLLGRIAAKDAVRRWLWAHGAGPLFPVEIAIGNDERGRPLVSGPFQQDLRVSIAHKPGIATAIVREGRDVGIDVEAIEPRTDRFAELVLSDVEKAMLPQGDSAEWLTRIWTGKEAAAKARGTGLNGRPRDFALSRVDAERLRIGDSWIRSQREGDFIVSWTDDH
jgi:acyl transferase domain-containing protein/phosphopantetheinyl transferase